MPDKKSAKIFGLFVFSVLMIFILSAVAIAADPATPNSGNTLNINTPQVTVIYEQGKDLVKKGVINVFGYTPDGESPFDLAFPKFLVFLLIAIIVYGISGMLPFFGDTGNAKLYLHIAFSAIVAFLSILYVTPQEIYASLVGYGAMAVVLTAIIPFMIMIAIYYKLATGPDMWGLLVARTLGIAFVIYLIYRIIVLWIFTPNNAWSGAVFVTALMLVVMLVLIWKDERLRHFFLKMQMKGYMEVSENLSKAEMLARIANLERLHTESATANPNSPFTQTLKEAIDNLKAEVSKIK
jgi:hypothetical protein